jgi:hypothetical protein
MTTLFDQRCQRLVAAAGEILDEIDRQLSMSERSREGELDDRNLNIAKSHVLELRDRLRSGKLPDKSDRYASMTRIIVDQWPFGTQLGKAISEIEASYKAL